MVRWPGGDELTFPRELLAGDVGEAARSLLGCLLVSRPTEPGTEADPDRGPDPGCVTVRITEVEAYAGADDPASHAWRGLTSRSAVMAGPAGHAYVYFSYGVHWCLNVTAGPEGLPSAVLIRAGSVISGASTAASRRPGVSQREQARGPGRLCRTLAVDGQHRGLDLCSTDSHLHLLRGPQDGVVRSGPRVGVTRAADRPWRFWLDGEPTVSGYRRSPRADPLPDSTT